MRRAAVLLVSLVSPASACGGSAPVCPTVAFGEDIPVPETHAMLTVPFRVGASTTCAFSVHDDTRPFANIERAALTLESGRPGTAQFGLDDWADVFVFGAVDCRTGCGQPGWYELHSVLWDRASSQVGLFIWYAHSDNVPAPLEITNSELFPAAAPFVEIFPNAVVDLTR